MGEHNITIARNEVYDALNLYETWRYKENGKYEQKGWENVLTKYTVYIGMGGTMSLESFKDSLSDYLYSGHCGY